MITGSTSPWLYEDFKDLMEHGQMRRAVKLSRELSECIGRPIYFSHTNKPHHAVSNLDAPTVFVHLNPGSYTGDTSSPEKFYAEKWNKDYFFKENELPHSAGLDEVISAYKKWRMEYAHNRFIKNNEIDNFDLKQACFLLHWPNSGIDLKKEDLKDRNTQRHNIVNVIDQKLQLELFPYASSEIDTHSIVQALEKKPDIIAPYIENLFNIIVQHPRRYVLFGSRLYQSVFRTYHSKIQSIIDFEESEQRFSGITQNRLSFSFMRLNWKGTKLNIGIAHSFARRDLPNAFDKMANYGQLCYEHFIKCEKK